MIGLELSGMIGLSCLAVIVEITTMPCDGVMNASDVMIIGWTRRELEHEPKALGPNPSNTLPAKVGDG